MKFEKTNAWDTGNKKKAYVTYSNDKDMRHK